MYIADISTVSEDEWSAALAEYHAAESALRDAHARANAAVAPYTYGDDWPSFHDVVRDDAPQWAVSLRQLQTESDDKIPYPNLHYVRYSATNTPAATVRKAAATRRNWVRKIDRAIARGGA